MYSRIENRLLNAPAAPANGVTNANGSKPAQRVDEIYAADVFTRRVMRQRLPKEVFKSLIRTIDNGAPLDPHVADVVAAIGSIDIVLGEIDR